MNIQRKEKIFNRWLVWVYYSDEESAFLEFEGLDEPTNSEIEIRFNDWVVSKEQNGTSN